MAAEFIRIMNKNDLHFHYYYVKFIYNKIRQSTNYIVISSPLFVALKWARVWNGW